MEKMQRVIGIKDLKVQCKIGCTTEERKKAQDILIDLKVSIDFSSLEDTDDLANTIDYVVLSDFCAQIACEREFNLIEGLASEIIQKLPEHFSIDGLLVRVKKASGLKSARYAYVELQKGEI